MAPRAPPTYTLTMTLLIKHLVPAMEGEPKRPPGQSA
jgi:hypothetical protein